MELARLVFYISPTNIRNQFKELAEKGEHEVQFRWIRNHCMVTETNTKSEEE